MRTASRRAAERATEFCPAGYHTLECRVAPCRRSAPHAVACACHLARCARVPPPPAWPRCSRRAPPRPRRRPRVSRLPLRSLWRATRPHLSCARWLPLLLRALPCPSLRMRTTSCARTRRTCARRTAPCRTGARRASGRCSFRTLRAPGRDAARYFLPRGSGQSVDQDTWPATSTWDGAGTRIAGRARTDGAATTRRASYVMVVTGSRRWISYRMRRAVVAA